MGARPRDGAPSAESGLDSQVAAQPAGRAAGDQDALVLSQRSRRYPGRERRQPDSRDSQLHILVRRSSGSDAHRAGCPNPGEGEQEIIDCRPTSMEGKMRKLGLLTAMFAALALSASAFAYEAMTVTNGGTISGTVKLDGAVPKPKQIEVSKDKEVCALKTHFDQELVVGDGGGIE